MDLVTALYKYVERLPPTLFFFFQKKNLLAPSPANFDFCCFFSFLSHPLHFIVASFLFSFTIDVLVFFFPSLPSISPSVYSTISSLSSASHNISENGNHSISFSLFLQQTAQHTDPNNIVMSTATQQQPPVMNHPVYRSGYIPPSPPDSPLPCSPEDVAVSASSSTSSVDQLPPAFSAEGTTPAPCDSHAHMVSHHSEIVVVDEHTFEDIHHAPPPPPFSEISRPTSPSPPQTTSTTLIINPHPLSHSFTAAALQAAAAASSTDEESDADQNIRAATTTESQQAAAATAYEDRHEAIDLEPESPRPYEHVHFTPTFSSSTTSFFTAPAPHAHHHHQHVNRNDNMSSPFSFFAHSSLAHGEHHNPTHVKTLRIEVEKNEVVLMAGSTTKLEGTLYLSLKHNTKVKTLQLEFSGRSSVTWVDGKSVITSVHTAS